MSMTEQPESGWNFTLITNPSQKKQLNHERWETSLRNAAITAGPFHHLEWLLYPFLLFLPLVLYIHAVWDHVDSFVLSNPGFITAEQVFPIQLYNKEFKIFLVLKGKTIVVFLTWWGSTEQVNFTKLPTHTISNKRSCQNYFRVVES